MTIQEAITRIDDLKPNSYEMADKKKWLNNIDWMIKTEIIDTHEGHEEYEDFEGYDTDTDLTTELLVGTPYDELYINWLEARIDYANGEYGRYNNTALAFNEALKQFRNYYNSTHMPLTARLDFFGTRYAHETPLS